LPRSEEAWYVIIRNETPVNYWSHLRQNFVPWIVGDSAEAYATREEAEQVAFSLTVRLPNWIGRIEAICRA